MIQSFNQYATVMLERFVLRPLSHITMNWELKWDDNAQAYLPEEDSFAAIRNQTIHDLSETRPPRRYHENEDSLADFVIEHLHWPIRKKRGFWVGAGYNSILEQGGFHDLDQFDLLQAAAGRVHAALDRQKTHFDHMEHSHQRMLAAVLSIILYHRGNEVGYQLG
ncbi:hypothetical protein OOT33_11065 [Sphingobium sp. DEHP117]|uniref:hypothetical protein n=1 Tax=Sphingobium sp. DEHP117 TaxID=2993436 RepID=UPI0027D71183|nr:hypothetical protein [Sphingobium sp. DEHP117]MDQ4420970.1 hypothetical protein [Sphingobium sp. DEHP117]